MKSNKFFSLIFFGSSLFIFACDPIPNKSISEPLSPEELSGIFEKDTSFKRTYEFIETANKLVLNTDVKRAEYLALTYKNFHKFFQEADNSSKAYKKLDSTFNAEWEKKVESYQPKIDSISSYWEEFYSDKKISEYADIEYSGTVKYTRYGFTNSFGLKFLISPKKNYVIDKAKVAYKIEDQILTKDLIYEEVLGIKQIFPVNDFFINRTIKGKEEVEIRITSSNSDVFYELFPNGLDYDKEIVVSFEELVVNGKSIRNEANSIPYLIKKYWIESLKNSEGIGYEVTITSIIQEYIEEDFEYQYEFTNRRIREYFEEKDPLSAKYFFQVADLVSKLKK